MPDYVCDVYGCGRILKKPSLLALHKKAFHTPAWERVFAFTCTREGCAGYRGTDSRGDFAKHEATHTPVKERVFAFTCMVADCSFRGTDSRRDLADHVATHTPVGARVFAYTCTVADCSFRGTDKRVHFEQHVATHKPAVYTHPCTFSGCSYTTKTAFMLARHMKRHAVAISLPYACRFCSKRFTENFNCKAHEKRHGE
jgi:hypothetical protein